MSLRDDFEELEHAIHEVSQGINAIGAMTMGLTQARDPYAGGFNAVFGLLIDADREVHKCLSDCIKALS